MPLSTLSPLAEEQAGALRAQQGKYLTFRLAEEEYGLEILKVQEIIKMMDITKVPRTPDFVRGVINLRGKVIPVVDLRLKFGMEAKETTDKTCVIVVQVRRNEATVTMGIIVDEVSEVLDIAAGGDRRGAELRRPRRYPIHPWNGQSQGRSKDSAGHQQSTGQRRAGKNRNRGQPSVSKKKGSAHVQEQSVRNEDRNRVWSVNHSRRHVGRLQLARFVARKHDVCAGRQGKRYHGLCQ